MMEGSADVTDQLAAEGQGPAFAVRLGSRYREVIRNNPKRRRGRRFLQSV